MYKHLFNNICYKEVDVGNILQYRSVIDLPMLLDKFPKTSKEHLKNQVLSGKSIDNELVWLEYNDDPTLSMFSGLYLIYPEMCKDVIEQVNYFLKLNLPVSSIILSKTSQTCHIHSDFFVRYGALNLYLENAEFAVTNFYNDEGTVIIDSLHAKTGKSYLLNVRTPHQVIQEPGQGDRLFFSISFFDSKYIKNSF
jgi:hypothetical protein